MAVIIIGVAIVVEGRRRKRSSEERRAAWKMHQEWLRSSEAQKLGRDTGAPVRGSERNGLGQG